MGVKIIIRTKELRMFEFKNSSIHRDEKGNYYYDGTPNTETDSGILVDFKMEHSYQIFEKLGNYWGGWNSTPSSKEMYLFAKEWDEEYGAKVVDVDYDSVAFCIKKDLSEKDIDNLVKSIRNVSGAEPCYDEGYPALIKDIRDNKRFEIWWD